MSEDRLLIQLSHERLTTDKSDQESGAMALQYSPNRTGEFPERTRNDKWSGQASAPSGPCSLNSHDSSLRSDVTKVDIPDYYDDLDSSLNLTTVTLKKCKNQVLRPYLMLLKFIGWRGFGRDSINPSHIKWRLFNSLYLVICLGLMSFCHVYEALTCSWKLDLFTDTKAPTVPPTHPPTHLPPTLFPSSLVAGGFHNNSSRLLETSRCEGWCCHHRLSSAGDNATDTIPSFILQPATTVGCQHIVTTYVLPNTLHFLAYIIGFFYFRIQENEQLYATMEKVFLQATPLQGRMVSQSNMIMRMRAFLVVGAGWVLLTLLLRILYVLNYGVGYRHFGLYLPWILFGFLVVGTLITSGVSLAVVVNYAAQCEMLTFFINGIQMRLQERSVHLRFIMKDILAVRQSLGQLNGAMSRMTSLLVVTFAEMVIISVSILMVNQNNCPLIWSYRGLFPVVWFLPFVFPLIQAARCNSVCSKFKRIALEIRVFGYQNSSVDELDSFLLFVANTRLRASLFHMPVRASYLIFAAVIVVVTIIVLIQNGVILVGKGI